MAYLFQSEDLDRREKIRVTAQQIWDTATDIEMEGGVLKLQFNPYYGIGLNEDPSTGEKFRTGYIITGIIDCGPNVTEYGLMTFDEDIYFGYSDITWEVRTSSTATPIDWGPWKESLDEVEIRQFVQFKFLLEITGDL